MIFKSCNNLFLIILALLISVFLNQDRIIRSFYNDTNKHAVPIASSRTFLGDDYYYYVAANDSLKLGLISKDKVYSTNNVLLGGLATSGLINLLCQSLISSSDIAVLVSIIFQTFLLVLATIYILKTIGRHENDGATLWFGFWAFITLILTEYFLLNSYAGSVHVRTLLSYYPNILRVVNPQMGWAFGLLYFASLFVFSVSNTLIRFLVLAFMSVVFSLFSLSLCLTMFLALTIFSMAYFFKNKRINYFYFSLALLLLISFLFNYLQLYDFQASPKGLEIGTGVIKGMVFKAHYFVFLLLIIPIAHYYKDKQFLILTSVLISSIFIGAFCDTIHLGDRLWIRGAAIYVWVMCIILISNWVKGRLSNKILPATGILLLSIWTFFLLPHQFNNDYGYVNSDKWVVLDWVNRNVPPDSVIMSEDLEFSFLLPIYTFSKAFVPLFGQSSISVEETVKRYYYTLDKYGSKDQLDRNLKDFNIQESGQNLQMVISGKQLDDKKFVQNAFFTYLIYYPYTKFSKSAFSSKVQAEKFFSVLDKWSKEKYSAESQPDYIIIKPNQLSEFGLTNQVVFKTDKYLLLSYKKIAK